LEKCLQVLTCCAEVFASVEEESVLEEIAESEEGRNKLIGMVFIFLSWECSFIAVILLQALLKFTDWQGEYVVLSEKENMVCECMHVHMHMGGMSNSNCCLFAEVIKM